MKASTIESQAAGLVSALDEAWARRHEYSLNALRRFPSAQAILKAEPAIQVAVVRRVLSVVAEFARRGKADGNHRWFSDNRFPWGCVYLQSVLLNKALPFAEADLREMIETLGEMGFLSASQFQFIGSLVGTLERYAQAHPISPLIRVKATKLADMLLGHGDFGANARPWAPDAADRRVGQRLSRLLEGLPSLSSEAPEFSPENAKQPGLAEPAPTVPVPSETNHAEELESLVDHLAACRSHVESAAVWDQLEDLARTLEKAPPSQPSSGRELPRVSLYRGEAWSDAAIADLKATPIEKQIVWLRLLAHCQTAHGGTPGDRWLETARGLVQGVGQAIFCSHVRSWLPLVNEPRTQPIAEWQRDYQPDPNQLIIEPHADILKGLAWCCGLKEDGEVARALTALALSAYRKIPLKGPREVKIGNACVTALGMMPGMEGVHQLALLKARVKFGTAQKFVEKAFTTAATRSDIRREELEEMAVPTCGLKGVGCRAEKLGAYTAELTVTGTDSTAIAWLKPDGQRQASVPAVVKEKFSDGLKELQSAAKDIQRMLPAQRERLDNLFREQKTWPFDVWRERYLEHPLVGVLARRLIWEFTAGQRNTAGIFFNDRLVDLDLKPLAHLGPDASVQLWHPIGKDTEEVVAWRSWLEAQQVQQPFKQAHREIYVLTEAESQTRTYSNRFAAHILRQHQFSALCAARGWKNKLRLMVDAEFPPATAYLPRWNLRAEFWVEGVGEDYGTDTNEAGVYLRLSTDQVRFYPMDPAAPVGSGVGYEGPGRTPEEGPLPLDRIPPLVFSEVMRDVDLFVGVASVGNDPTWSDGGPEGRYRDYWQSYAFGDLTASAKTRKEVLERLVPRLRIAPVCSIGERFLVVKGKLRTCKIHLGSGSILMAPNDQYLCIVPKQSAKQPAEVILPFEGDHTLSVILSKAFLLAEDASIKDPSITRQIRRQ